MNEIIINVKKELLKQVDPAYRKGEVNFFKEKIVCFGIRTPKTRKIADSFWPQIKKLDKKALFKLMEEMLRLEYMEYATIVSSWIWKMREELKPEDFKVFKIWVEKYLDNWAKIDDFCTHNLGYLINQYPELAPRLLEWTKSNNRWVKRASAVALIYPFTKKKKYLTQIFKTAEALLTDPDDLVQKGYGWMLKVTSDHYQKQVFEFVMKHRDIMPRTALRYAIEKMPRKLKEQAMVKDLFDNAELGSDPS